MGGRTWDGMGFENALKDRFEDVSRYADIIERQRPVSSAHPPMPNAERAAQFSPFAALAGHEDAIKRTVERAQERVLHEIERET